MSRQNSEESYTCEQNRDMVTAANPNSRMVPEFLTGRPMQSSEPLQRLNSNNDESQNQAQLLPLTPLTNLQKF